MNNNMMWGGGGKEKRDAIGQENDSCMPFSLIKLKRGSEGTQSPRNETRAELREVEERGCEEGGGGVG